jgi:hypothetical protein
MVQAALVMRCDSRGITDNDEFGRHLQTYFMVFRRQVIQAACFMDFWRSVLPLNDKQQVFQLRNWPDLPAGRKSVQMEGGLRSRAHVIIVLESTQLCEGNCGLVL